MPLRNGEKMEYVAVVQQLGLVMSILVSQARPFPFYSTDTESDRRCGTGLRYYVYLVEI